MSPGSLLNTLTSRFATAWRDAVASAVAAGIAWTLAVWLFGHSHPVFAAISAIICLAPGLPNHGRQALGLILGVATGIVIGELALMLPESLLMPEGMSLLRLVLATLFAMLVATAFGGVAVVPIQAGVSAVLVLALGPHSAGLVRLEDVVVGVMVGLLFSQVLLTPDPVRQIDAAADDLLLRLAKAFRICAEALKHRDMRKVEVALKAFSATHASLIALGEGIGAAQHAARWSVRGRLTARAVAETAARYDRHAIRLYASSLLFGEALENALRKQAESVPEELAARILDVAARCTDLAEEKPAAVPAIMQEADSSAIALEWRTAIDHLQSVSNILADLEALAPTSPSRAYK
ncbi:FUSC family protein [Methylobacillus arboreus]|uniref:FUSC family protein n=1 Tax=Methylobacillus arboreus TaxID=755170 RepID=UPI001E349A53|nr:FUSC family protein [Methylobacillus arboreus]MCB5191649.1 FUSC family protein [Methylobacillus arboreus]